MNGSGGCETSRRTTHPRRFTAEARTVRGPGRNERDAPTRVGVDAKRRCRELRWKSSWKGQEGIGRIECGTAADGG